MELINIGKIINTHGIRGELKIYPLTDDLTRFEKLSWVYIQTEKDTVKYNIDTIRYFKNIIILKFKEFDNINDVLNLKNTYIQIDRENAVKLPKDRFFLFDLIGMKVFESTGNYLGELYDVLQTGSNDVYIIKREGNKDLLIPALKKVVKEVDIENKIMKVELLEGLLDL